MPHLQSGLKARVAMALPGKPNEVCYCHERDYAPWTGEIHGLSQALMSKSRKQKLFWWLVLIICIFCGIFTTVLVVIEYVEGPTATSTTIKMVNTLEFPTITVCPKVPDAFNFTNILEDIHNLIPDIDEIVARDLISYFIAGSGLENMDMIPYNNISYNKYLNSLYLTWSRGYSPGEFFDRIQNLFGYKCEDFLFHCELGGKVFDCCTQLFRAKSVMRRGLCYQTFRNVNQTEADDIGRLVIEMKQLSSTTSRAYNYTQPQVIVYINDNWDYVIDFPRYYLYPHEWNRMHFTARYIELLEHPEDCTNKIFGKDAHCFVRNWMYSNIVDPYNCTLPYMRSVVDNVPVCEPIKIVPYYYDAIQLVHSGAMTTHDCIPGK
uniref:Uncharacterized protein n=1 Tax=Panagrolaimus sp. ES5 TaxID=591445 RepID=A0AC34FH35_9BILA